MADRKRDSQYDLVAIDVDGTLLTSRGELSSEVEAALQDSREQGVLVSLVSGRAKVAMLPLVQALNLDVPFIANGGAYIEDPLSGQVIDHQTLEWADVIEIVQIARLAGASVFFENPDRLLGELKAGHEGLIHGADRAMIQFVDDLLSDNAGSATKIAVLGEPRVVKLVEERLRGYKPSLHVAYPFPTALDISGPGVTKGTALERLARHLRVPLSRVIAIGDQQNDVSMFGVAALSVAMGNAPPKVLAVADVTAPSNDEDGVAWALCELVLKTVPLP
jgi:Cof subfamily protein (haloacid dehalogenase superfamily)